MIQKITTAIWALRRWFTQTTKNNALFYFANSGSWTMEIGGIALPQHAVMRVSPIFLSGDETRQLEIIVVLGWEHDGPDYFRLVQDHFAITSNADNVSFRMTYTFNNNEPMYRVSLFNAKLSTIVLGFGDRQEDGPQRFAIQLDYSPSKARLDRIVA